MTTTATAALIDPATKERVWTHGVSGRHYVPQSLRGYLLGRALDVIIVAAAAFVLTHVAVLLLQSTTLMGQEWQQIAVFGLILFTAIFLYGGAAGTIGTLGEALTRMRVVNIDDGKGPGFRAGGLRAVGWFLYVIFTLMLSDTGAAETRFVAVRTSTGVFRGERPVSAAKVLEPHTNQA